MHLTFENRLYFDTTKPLPMDVISKTGLVKSQFLRKKKQVFSEDYRISSYYYRVPTHPGKPGK